MCWTKPLQLTKIESCTAEIISMEGSGCGQGGVATLCASMQKKLDEKAKKKKPSELDPPTCPAGQTCTNLNPVTQVELFNENMNFKVCGSFPFSKVCCTFNVILSGKFIGTGEVGTCCSDPTGKKCQ